MITNAGPSKLFFKIGLLVIALPMAAVTSADCIKDLSGEYYCGAGRCRVDGQGTVWCSRHYNGDAVRTMDGQVLCGVGQCNKSYDGQVFCSSEIGGTVLRDSRGRARCYGQCEPGTLDNCENSRADVAER